MLNLAKQLKFNSLIKESSLLSKPRYASSSSGSSSSIGNNEASNGAQKTQENKEQESVNENRMPISSKNGNGYGNRNNMGRYNHNNNRNSLSNRREDRDLWGISPFGHRNSNFWDPFDHFGQFSKLVNRMDDMFGLGKVGSFENSSDWRPSADIVPTKEGYELTAELPGVSKDNVKIEIEDDVITLRGEKKTETEKEEGQGGYYQERSYGSFVRRFQLPEGIDPKLVKAEFKDGVLKMKIPKKQQQESKLHEVKID